MSTVQQLALSKVCRRSDLEHPELRRLAAEIVPGGAGRLHRKVWEFALGVHALERAGVLHDDAEGLSVAAGHEALLFYLANRCRRIFATDLYGGADWDVGEGTPTMLTDPDAFAPYPYRRGRLVVSHMDALDLRFDDATLDFVISMGSIEDFGGARAAARALAEMTRVVRPGGLIFLTTELLTSDDRSLRLPGTTLFSPEALQALVADRPELEWFGGEKLDGGPDEEEAVTNFFDAGTIARAGLDTEPHLRVAFGEHVFTSVSLALRRRSA